MCSIAKIVRDILQKNGNRGLLKNFIQNMESAKFICVLKRIWNLRHDTLCRAFA